MVDRRTIAGLPNNVQYVLEHTADYPDPSTPQCATADTVAGFVMWCNTMRSTAHVANRCNCTCENIPSSQYRSDKSTVARYINMHFLTVR
jgi:hypothetical protein